VLSRLVAVWRQANVPLGRFDCRPSRLGTRDCWFGRLSQAFDSSGSHAQFTARSGSVECLSYYDKMSLKDLRKIAIKAAGMSEDRIERARWMICAILLGRPFSLRMLQFAEWEPHNTFFKADPHIPRRNPSHFPYRACRDIGRSLKFPLEPDTLPYYEVSFSHGPRTVDIFVLHSPSLLALFPRALTTSKATFLASFL
jgi:hypothetical protein